MLNSLELSKPYKLTAGCEKYIRNVLCSGRSLARALESGVKLAKGNVRILPDLAGYEELTAEQFRNGGVWGIAQQSDNIKQVPDPERPELVTNIAEFLSKPKRFVVFEHKLALATDPWLKGKEPSVAYFHKEVYFPLEAFSGVDAIEYAIKMSSDPTGTIGVFSDISESAGYPSGRSLIETGDLRLLVEGLRYLIIGAFDGEGYILWQAES